ncbi:MAG: NADH-quinone oxidoreductase subunit H [Candidatus Altiarchaeota archaeon]|nr:NADH-quinone oxidoreductase subunit H [Candidatus Altiarchaeota archaeon]
MPARLLLFLVPFFFEWVKRKIDARVERRVGPPLMQPIYDYFKLLHKEIIIPEGAGIFFRLGPILLFLFSVFAVFIAWSKPTWSIVYLLAIFAMMTFVKMLMSSSVKSQFTVFGTGRLASMKLALDPAFPLAFLAPAFVWGFDMVWPIKAGLFLPLAFIAAIAELELPPFDISHAKTEIVAGWKTEFSGGLLALINYAENAKMVAVSLMLAALLGPSVFWLKTLGVFMVMAIFSIALPRMRINKAIRFLSFINILTMLEVIVSLNWAYLLV